MDLWRIFEALNNDLGHSADKINQFLDFAPKQIGMHLKVIHAMGIELL
jgi:hypothetical protein